MIFIENIFKTLYRNYRKTKSGKCNVQDYINKNNLDWNDWYIELYEIFACKNKEELQKREGEVIREIGTLNKRIAGRSRQEWKKDNRDILLEKGRNYYHNNKERYLEKVKCECGCIFSQQHLLSHKKTKKHQDLLLMINS